MKFCSVYIFSVYRGRAAALYGECILFHTPTLLHAHGKCEIMNNRYSHNQRSVQSCPLFNANNGTNYPLPVAAPPRQASEFGGAFDGKLIFWGARYNF
jgi:hypothetical protein